MALSPAQNALKIEPNKANTPFFENVARGTPCVSDDGVTH